MTWHAVDRVAGTPPDATTEGRWRGRFVATLGAAAVVASVLQMVVYAWNAHWPNAAVTAVGVTVTVAWVALWRRYRNPALQADTFAGFATTVYGASLLFNKDIANIAWLGVTPLLALFIGGARPGLRWTVIVLLVAIAGVAVIASGHAPPSIVPVTFADVGSRLVALLVVLPTAGLLWELSARSIMKDLARANDEAQAAGREKLRFLANISHELRTPLHGMLGIGELLRADTSSPQVAARLEVMAESGRLLAQLIDDLLDVTRAEAGQLRLTEETTRLDRLVENACDVHRSKAEAKGLVFKVALEGPVETLVRTDPRRVQQVVHNLVSNAVKFTASGSVTTSLAARVDGDRLVTTLSVRDTGRGIDPAVHEKLFLPFSRVEEDARIAGTGLGLSITRTIVERLGGTVTVASQPGRGATFTATVGFPLAPPQSLPPGEPALEPLSRRLDVLIVDDNAVNRTVAAIQLQKLGATTATASDGAQALLQLEARAFDLVLMDRHMPGLDGLEVTRRWRAREGADEHLTIIGVTASAMPEDLAACRAAGMDDVVTKPLPLEGLRALVQRVCDQAP
ncbi:MAG: response regulator [Myxococcus sp.]|nr:response regulator [Myxococcus sp.]